MTWLLVALVVAPSFLGSPGVLADSRPDDSAAGRECGDPLSEDADPAEESDPVEGTAEEAQGKEFLHASSLSLLRQSPRSLPGPIRPRPDRRDAMRRPGPRRHERSSLATSGRVLRRWLQSHVC